MDDILLSLWKGGIQSTSFPHRCPFRQDGASKEVCVEISGQNFQQNKNGCCGTFRGSVKFEPCNSAVRRCIVCLEMGRRGIKANSVANPSTGRCEQHEMDPKLESLPLRKEFRLPSSPVERVVPLVVHVPSAAPSLVPEEPAPAIAKEKVIKQKEKKIVIAPPEPVAAVKTEPTCTPVQEDDWMATALASANLLSERRYKMLRCCGLGMDNAEIARAIGTTTGTISVEFATLFKKLGLAHLPKKEKRQAAVQVAKTFFADDPAFKLL